MHASADMLRLREIAEQIGDLEDGIRELVNQLEYHGVQSSTPDEVRGALDRLRSQFGDVQRGLFRDKYCVRLGNEELLQHVADDHFVDGARLYAFGDMNGLKAINETYEYATGSSMIAELAKNVADFVDAERSLDDGSEELMGDGTGRRQREFAVVALGYGFTDKTPALFGFRLGGDEFVVGGMSCRTQFSEGYAKAFCRRLVRRCGVVDVKYYVEGRGEVTVRATVSWGVVVVSAAEATAFPGLRKYAERNCKASKHQALQSKEMNMAELCAMTYLRDGDSLSAGHGEILSRRRNCTRRCILTVLYLDQYEAPRLVCQVCNELIDFAEDSVRLAREAPSDIIT